MGNAAALSQVRTINPDDQTRRSPLRLIHESPSTLIYYANPFYRREAIQNLRRRPPPHQLSLSDRCTASHARDLEKNTPPSNLNREQYRCALNLTYAFATPDEKASP